MNRHYGIRHPPTRGHLGPDTRDAVAIIGAGPSGLTAGHHLTAAGHPVTVLEADPHYVGGISRTVRYKDFRFDIGGHRFFSKSPEVVAFWHRLLGPDLMTRQRSSRIFYRGQFFQYPLRPADAFSKLGPAETFRCIASFVKARLAPTKPAVSFQDWVTNEFGHRLFEIFFKTYTEKVWGMDCRDISADWAAQRIKGLSLASAIADAFRPASSRREDGDTIKTLTQQFLYPRLGPGMMWEACAAEVEDQGGQIRLGRRVVACRLDDDGTWHVTHTDDTGATETLEARHVISSAPLRELVGALHPEVPPAIQATAARLRYRDFLIVVLIARATTRLQDQWIYVHDPRVRVGRIQNFTAWSPDMVPDDTTVSYGLEYFCFEDDDLWSRGDDELIALATDELIHVGLASREDIQDGCVIRQRQAYPVYDDGYREGLERIRGELEARFPTLHVVGRNGMHRYNNQDHAMMTAMLTAKNIQTRTRTFDVWRVNNDAEYIESSAADLDRADGRLVPRPIAAGSRAPAADNEA